MDNIQNPDFTSVQTYTDFHPNGQLRFIETIAILKQNVAHHYTNNSRVHPDGYEWIRIDRCAKYFDNGQLNWEMLFNSRGTLIKNKPYSFRKDGTVIE